MIGLWRGFGILLAGIAAGVLCGASFSRQDDEELSVTIWGNEPHKSKVAGEAILKRRGQQWVGEWMTAKRVKVRKGA